MELKKNKTHDLEGKSPLFFFIGLVIALSLILVAFEWKSEFDPLELRPLEDQIEDFYFPEVTIHKVPEPPKVIERKVEKPKSIQPPIFVDEKVTEKKSLTTEILEIDIPKGLTEAVPTIETPEFYEGPVESAPEFPGGIEKFYEYVSKNMKFPTQAKRIGIEGKVYVRFIINTDGSVTDVEVIKGIGYGCDAAAKYVLENSPKFIPAKNRGRAVRYRQVIPIYFKYSD